MNLVLVGMSHRSAPLVLRERYAVAPADCRALNEKLMQQAELAEACLVSTCNRTELLAVSQRPDAATACLYEFLASEIGGEPAPAEHLYALRGGDAVQHLFRVAASLDSLVLGESQILGQLKQAYRAATEARSCGPVLHRLFHRAFRTAKRVRSVTGLGIGATSVARIGVQLASQLFESFEGKRVLLLGAGDTAESAMQALRDAGVRSLVVVNRSTEPARHLAERLGGRAAPLDQLERELADADLAILSLAVEAPILTAERLAPVTRLRHGRPLLLIDLGIPRNAEPEVNELDNAYLYDLDDLEQVAANARELREHAIEPAERIVAEERAQFERWREALPLAPTIRDLLARARAVTLEELRVSLAGEPGRDEREAELGRVADAVVAKLFHVPLTQLREESEAGTGAWYADALRQLFGLEEAEPDGEDE